MSPEWISLLASVIYGVPSSMLYILTGFIILKHRKEFSSSFFILYTYDGITNLFAFTGTFFLLRLNKVTCDTCVFAPLYRNLGIFIPLNLVLSMSVHTAYVQYSITTLVSLNRLSVLLNYNLMEPFWKRSTWLFIFIIWLAPLLSTHIVFYYEAKVVYMQEAQYYSIRSDNFPHATLLAGVVPFTVLATILSVIVNTISIVIVRRLKTQVRNKAEANFLVIMSITCAVQVLGSSITVAFAVSQTTPFISFLKAALPYVSDGLTLVQPWLLVCFSNAMKHRVKRIFCWSPKPRVSGQMFQTRSVTN